MQGFGVFIGLHLLNARFKKNIQRSHVTRISNPKIVKKRFRFPDGVVVPLYVVFVLVNRLISVKIVIWLSCFWSSCLRIVMSRLHAKAFVE